MRNGQPLPFNNYAVTRSNSDPTFTLSTFAWTTSSRPTAPLFVRHSFQNTDAVTPSIFGLPLGGPPTRRRYHASARNQNAGIGHIYQFTPTLINEIRIGLNRQTTALTQEDYGQNLSQQFGIPGVNRSPQTSGLSTLAISGLFSLGGSILTPLRVAATDWNFSDKVTWVKGRHTSAIRLRRSIRDGQHRISGFRPRQLYISQPHAPALWSGAGRQRVCELSGRCALSGAARRVFRRAWWGSFRPALRLLSCRTISRSRRS